MIYLFFIILAILLEGTVVSLPVVLDLLLIFFVLKKRSRVLVPAFFSGLALDIFRVRTLGITGVFFIVFIFLVFLYERKFEIATYPFVFFASFLGGAVYLHLFGYNNVFWQGVINSIVAVLLFKFSIFNSKFSMKSKFEN